jgi:MFS family permease
MLALLASIVSKYFFPHCDIVVSIFYTYVLISISYIAKPLGAIIIGKIGDKYGRAATINISLAGTSIASLFISLIPGYNMIGNLSIILLLVSRMFIAALVSSGTDGIRLFVFEKIAKHKQCIGVGLVTSSTMVGILLASISVNYFTSQNMPDWAWRLCFAIGSLFGIFVLLLRKFFIKDSENYVAKEYNYKEFKDQNSLNIIKDHMNLFILSILISGSIGSFTQFYIIFLVPFCSDILHLVNHVDIGHYRTIAIVLYILLAVIGGYIADKFGKQLINKIAGFALLIIGLLLIKSFINNEFNSILYLLGASCIPIIIVPSMVILKESVPMVIRYRIFSLAHAIGSIFISAPTSAFSIYLYKSTNIVWLPLIYFLIIILILIVSVHLLNKKAKKIYILNNKNLAI